MAIVFQFIVISKFEIKLHWYSWLQAEGGAEEDRSTDEHAEYNKTERKTILEQSVAFIDVKFGTAK